MAFCHSHVHFGFKFLMASLSHDNTFAKRAVLCMQRLTCEESLESCNELETNEMKKEQCLSFHTGCITDEGKMHFAVA